MSEATTIQDSFEAEGFDDPIELATFIEKHWPDSDYWQSCWGFINENWKRELNSLSPKQNKWAEKILEDCVEKSCS